MVQLTTSKPGVVEVAGTTWVGELVLQLYELPGPMGLRLKVMGLALVMSPKAVSPGSATSVIRALKVMAGAEPPGLVTWIAEGLFWAGLTTVPSVVTVSVPDMNLTV